LIVTWFPAAPQQIVYPLATICDPYLNLFRGIIPPLGGIDLSPILAFTALNFFTSTAAALPAQIDGDGNIVGVPEKKNVLKGLFAEKKEKR
jgi:YggT family protein